MAISGKEHDAGDGKKLISFAGDDLWGAIARVSMAFGFLYVQEMPSGRDVNFGVYIRGVGTGAGGGVD